MTALAEVDPKVIEEGPFCGVMPAPAYWKAILRAIDEIGSVTKDAKLPKDAGKKAGRKFSSYNHWLRICRPVLSSLGLVCNQSSRLECLSAGNEEGRGTKIKLAIKFLVIHAESGTGMVYRMDWPLWGGQGPASDDTGAALSWAWKYGLRALLMIDQTEEDVPPNQQRKAALLCPGGCGQIESLCACPAPRGGDRDRGRGRDRSRGRDRDRDDRDDRGRDRSRGRDRDRDDRDDRGRDDYDRGQGRDRDRGRGRGRDDRDRDDRGRGRGRDDRDRRPRDDHGRRGYEKEEGRRRAAEGDRREREERERRYEEEDRRRESQKKPLRDEDVVRHAKDTLGPESPDVDRGANPEPAHRAAPGDGQRDPTFEDLMAVGWDQKAARQFAAVGANDPIPEAIRDLFTNVVVNDYFRGDMSRANALWGKDENGPDTGFVPEPGSGKMPTGAQLRRYLVKLEFNSEKAGA